MKYRSDVDGLRAVAVVPVVLYHFGSGWVPGGFVGVDIFFVISGFLITRLISEEMDSGDYSVVRFYARRARRIFPALFFMCACCFAFAYLYYLPNEIAGLGRGLMATTLFVSNVYFYLTQNYFAASADTNALLHTWSLSVEEQFYIVFPLVLLLLRRRAAAAERWILWALACASLLVSARLAEIDPTAAFYLPDSRAWELLLGALLAIGRLPEIRVRGVAESLAAAGLALILISILAYSRKTTFPGLAAVAPCAGAALIIQAGKGVPTLTSRLLALYPVRFIGFISYSLYLWHWPINVGLRFFAVSPTLPEKVGAISASFVAAALSWKFVEQPLRRAPFRLRDQSVLAVAGGAMLTLVLLAAVAYPLSTWRWQFSAQIEQVLALGSRDFGASMRSGSCFLTSFTNDFAKFDRATCLQLSPTRRNFLLLGDSHAADLWPGLARVDPEVNLLQATASGCMPLIGNAGSRRCTDLMRFIFNDFLPKNHLDAILISGRWHAEDVASARATAEALERYADRVILLGPAVEYGHPLPRTAAVSLATHDPLVIENDRSPEILRTDRLLSQQFAGTGVRYFSIYEALCPLKHCRVFDTDGMPLEFDTDHFTLNGSIYVARSIRESGILGLPNAAGTDTQPAAVVAGPSLP